MRDIFQKTISEPVSFEGIGLHYGVKSKITLLPASENEGVVFERKDLITNNTIIANYKNVSSARLCTTLTNSHNVSVSTVEHLMAAFYFTGIDNIKVEIDNAEVPIMDGSSKEFVETIKKTGLTSLNKTRKFLKITKKFSFEDEKRKISILPSNEGLEVDFQLDYDNLVIGKQRNNVSLHVDQNLEKIYNSRTFCIYEDIEKIKKLGLAKGGSLNNAVVVKDKEILNSDGLRNDKEFVNHKILDLAGDFFLSGYRILGRVECKHGGHQLSNLFLSKLLEDNSNYLIVDFNNSKIFNKETNLSINKIAVNA